MYYHSGSDDRAILLSHLPKPVGISPLIVTSDIELRFAYAMDNQNNQSGSFSETEPVDAFVEVVRDESLLSQEYTSEVYVLWETGICPGYIYRYYHRQEHLSAHPLSKRGLVPCGVFEVKPSAWLHHLQSAEPENFSSEFISVDPVTRTKITRQRTYHHLLFAFRDTTLELITDRLSYELFQGIEQVRQVLQHTKWGEDAYGS